MHEGRRTLEWSRKTDDNSIERQQLIEMQHGNRDYYVCFPLKTRVQSWLKNRVASSHAQENGGRNHSMESNGSESLKDTHIKDQTNTEHHTDADQRDIEGDTDTNGTDRKSYVPPGPEPILRVEKSRNEGHRCTYLCRIFSRRERPRNSLEESEFSADRDTKDAKRKNTFWSKLSYFSNAEEKNKICTNVTKILNRFSERTSLQGVTYIKYSTLTGRLLWIFILLTCFSLLTAHMFYLCTVYYSYPTKSVVELGFSALSFPAITICNVNPVRKSRMSMMTSELKTLVRKTSPTEMANIFDEERESLMQNNMRRRTVNEARSTGKTDLEWSTLRTPTSSSQPSVNEADMADMADMADISQGNIIGKDLSTLAYGYDNEIKVRKRGQDVRRENTKDNYSNKIATEVPDNVHQTGNVPQQRISTQSTKSPQFLASTRIKRASDGSPNAYTETNNFMNEGTPEEKIESNTSSTKPETNAIPNNKGNNTVNNTSKVSIFKCPKSNIITDDNDSTIPEESEEDFKFINSLHLKLNFTQLDILEKLKEKFSKDKGPFEKASVTAMIQEEFQRQYSSLPRDIRTKIGHQAKDMIVDCSFAGKQCHPQNFTLLSSFTFGNCFTLDYPDLISARSGIKGGLTLVLFLESGEYLQGITSGTGIQVIIHDHSTIPYPHENGIAIMAGTETNLGLKRGNINRLGPPYGECEESFRLMTGSDHQYTRRACQQLCEHKEIIEQCSCLGRYRNEEMHIHTTESKYGVCQSESERRCMVRVETQFENGELECNCKNPCFERTYSNTLSIRQWPTDEFANLLVAALCIQKSKMECSNYKRADSRSVANNFLKLNVYYEDLNYQNITEVADYEFSQFVSDIGGTVGLWLGLSAVSMFEIFQFLSELIGYLMFNKCVRIKNISAPLPRLVRRNLSLLGPVDGIR